MGGKNTGQQQAPRVAGAARGMLQQRGTSALDSQTRPGLGVGKGTKRPSIIEQFSLFMNEDSQKKTSD